MQYLVKPHYVMSKDVFISVPSLEPVESVLWKITKHSEIDCKNKILLFQPVALYYKLDII